MRITIELDSLSVEARVALARSVRDTATLAMLALDANWQVRFAIANNGATRESTLEKLRNDSKIAVVMAANRGQ